MNKIDQRCKPTNTGTALDHPALQFAVGVAGVVDEATVAPTVLAVHKQSVVQLHYVEVTVRGGQL